MTKSLLLLVITLCLFMLGCQKKLEDSDAFKSLPKQQQLGVQLLSKHQCLTCHRFGSVGNEGKDLSHTGRMHNNKWISEKIKNPQKYNPSSKMRAVPMSDEARNQLAAFLADQH